MRSVVIGLRLWGIALEPFWPDRNGSSTSRTSVRWRWRTSVARRSSPAPASAIVWSSSAWRWRGTTWGGTYSARRARGPRPPGPAVARDDLGRDVLGAQVQALEHPRLVGGVVGGVGADRARDRADRGLREGALEPLRVAVSLEGEAGELESERRGLGVHAVGAPDAQRVAELARALREGDRELARAREDRLARAAQLERERRVEHVGGRQPVVDPAAGRPGGGGEHVDEGGDVMVRDGLALGDGLDRERRGADRGQFVGRGSVLERLGGGDLHVAPRGHARLVRPDGAELGPGVARDHGP